MKKIYCFEDFEEGIKETWGIKSKICEKVGCTYPTLQAWIKDYPELQVMIEAEKILLHDKCRDGIANKIVDEDPGMLRFYAKTRLPEYKVIEGRELTNPDGSLKPTDKIELSIVSEEESMNRMRAAFENQKKAREENKD